MFNTQGQTVNRNLQKTLSPGVVYAHIVSGKLKTSKTGKKKLILLLETPPIEGFEGWPIDKDNPNGEKHKGQIANVDATIWTDTYNNPNISDNEIMSRITTIAVELDLKDRLDMITAETIEEWVEKAINLLKNKDMYFFLSGAEEMYNGKVFVKLSFSRYRFCSLNKEHLDTFNKNNIYHYKALKQDYIDNFESDFDV